MEFAKNVLLPKSRNDKNSPYTYIAKVAPIKKEGNINSKYYADVIFVLVKYLGEKGILPSEDNLFGLYSNHEIILDNDICLDNREKWLAEPEIFDVLEEDFE